MIKYKEMIRMIEKYFIYKYANFKTKCIMYKKLQCLSRTYILILRLNPQLIQIEFEFSRLVFQYFTYDYYKVTI